MAFENLVKVAQLLPDPRWLDGVGGQQDLAYASLPEEVQGPDLAGV